MYWRFRGGEVLITTMGRKSINYTFVKTMYAIKIISCRGVIYQTKIGFYLYQWCRVFEVSYIKIYFDQMKDRRANKQKSSIIWSVNI